MSFRDEYWATVGTNSMLTREQEIAAWEAGDHDALVRSNLAWVVSFVERICRGLRIKDQSRREDLVAVGNLALVKCVKSFDARQSSLCGYSRRAIKWAVWETLRKDRVDNESLAFDPVGTASEAHESVVSDEDISLLRTAISNLPVGQKRLRAVARYLLSGMTQLEIAEAMGVTKQRVSQLYLRLLPTLREAMSAA